MTADTNPISRDEVIALSNAFERSADWLDKGALTGSARTHPLVGTADYRRACTILRAAAFVWAESNTEG